MIKACLPLIFGLLACGSTTTTTGQNPDQQKSTLTSASTAKLNDGSNGHETGTCNFDSILSLPETPKLAKDIYLENDWNIGNDAELLALLDSLTARNIHSRAFYFKVVTQSERKSDGYYTEALSYAGYHFVLNHTAAFAAYFDDRSCHTDEDLKTWARIVAMEIAINGEGNDQRTFRNEYIRKLNTNCNSCTPNQQETIREFSRELKKITN